MIQMYKDRREIEEARMIKRNEPVPEYKDGKERRREKRAKRRARR